MLDNVYKNNKNGSSVVTSAGTGESVIVLRPQPGPYWWVFAVLVTGLLATLVLYFFLSLSKSGADRYSHVLSGSSSNVHSATLVRDIESLKGQMNILITGAMETKIQQLEESLQSGIISAADLGTIRELKEDLKALRAYSVQKASTTFGLTIGSENPGGQTAVGLSQYSEELLNEVSKMKNLFYISIASWGVAIVIFGGTWLRGYYRLKQVRCERLFHHQLLEKPKTGLY
jgi:hypothetical protein